MNNQKETEIEYCNHEGTEEDPCECFVKIKENKIEKEINKRKIMASMKETPHCFGECLTVGDVEEVLEIKEKEMLDDEIKFLELIFNHGDMGFTTSQKVQERLSNLKERRKEI